MSQNDNLHDELARLRAENKELLEEVARLRAQQDASMRTAERMQFFSTALMQSPVAFGSGTTDGKLYLVNDALAKMTGYTLDEFTALKSWAVDITPARFREHEGQFVKRFIETGEPQIYEKAFLRKDGTEVPVEVWLNATFTETGDIDMLYIFAADISERKRAMKLLTEHQERLETAVKERTAELETKITTIEQQREQLAELSVPVLNLWNGVLALPIIGQVDETRASLITEALLNRISVEGARWVIIDLTGVSLLDGTTANQFGAIMRGVELMGANCVVSGIGPAVARTMVEMGADLQRCPTFGNLEAALRHCMGRTKGFR